MIFGLVFKPVASRFETRRPLESEAQCGDIWKGQPSFVENTVGDEPIPKTVRDVFATVSLDTLSHVAVTTNHKICTGVDRSERQLAMRGLRLSLQLVIPVHEHGQMSVRI